MDPSKKRHRTESNTEKDRNQVVKELDELDSSNPNEELIEN